MNKYKYFIGIDVSKKKLDVCVLKNKEVLLKKCIANTAKELNALTKVLIKMDITLSNALICCEHTGIYTSKVLSWGIQKGYNLWLEKAIQIKKSIGLQRGKNDMIDAYRIAMYAFRFQDVAVIYQQSSGQLMRLKDLMANRIRILKAKKQLEVPLKERATILSKKEYQQILKNNKDALQGIKKSLKQIEKNILDVIKENAELSKKVEYATSVDGVGLITAAFLIAATNEFKHVKSSKELACYIGLSPFENKSGSSIRGRSRISHHANKTLKALVHMCAISSIKYSEEMRTYYERKVNDGKHKMAVINAVRNKIIKRVYACVTQERKYEKNYTRKVA